MLSSIIASIVNGYASDLRVQDIAWALEISKSSLNLLYEDCNEEQFLEAIKNDKIFVTTVLDSYHNTGGTSLEVFITDVNGQVVSTCSNMTTNLQHLSTFDEKRDAD